MLEVDFGPKDIDLGYCFVIVYLLPSVVTFRLKHRYSTESPRSKIVPNTPMTIECYLNTRSDNHLPNV